MYRIRSDEEARSHGTKLGLNEPALDLADDLLEGFVDRIIEIHHGKILAIIADADAVEDCDPVGAIYLPAGRHGDLLKERRFADAVRTSEEKMRLPAKRDRRRERHRLMRLWAQNRILLDLQDLAGKIRL